MNTQETVNLIMKIWYEFKMVYGKNLNGERVVLTNQLDLWPAFLRAYFDRID